MAPAPTSRPVHDCNRMNPAPFSPAAPFSPSAMAALRTGRPYLHEAELDLVADRLIHAARRLEDLAIAAAESRKITAAQWRVMSAIAPVTAMTLGALREKLNLTKQSLHGVVAALTASDIVVKTAGEADGRRKSLRLSPNGIATHGAIATVARQRLAQCLREFGPEQTTVFRHILGTLTEAP